MTAKDKILKAIEKGDLNNGIALFLEAAKVQDSQLYNSALGLSARYQRLRQEKNMGTIGYGDEQRTYARITQSLLAFLSELQESEADFILQNNKKENLEWNDFLRWLNRLLAGYIYKSDEIRQLAKSFNLPVISMNWDNSARTNWFNVLDYYISKDTAGETKKDILSIIKYVMDTYGTSADLEKAMQWAMPVIVEKPLNEKDYENKVGKDSNFEKLMKKGVNTLLPLWFLELGLEKGKPVGRIETSKEYGTGFIVQNNYVLTNNHIISTEEEGKQSFIEMNYEKTSAGGDKKRTRYHFDLSKPEYFSTSVDDDWTLIKIKETVDEKWNIIELKEIEGTHKDDRVTIIQHPEGRHKQVGLHNNFITYIDDDQIMYLTDTLEGSSGSPVFNQQWELVGLHREGGYLREPTEIGKVWRNAGTNINKVLKGIRENNIPGF